MPYDGITNIPTRLTDGEAWPHGKVLAERRALQLPKETHNGALPIEGACALRLGSASSR